MEQESPDGMPKGMVIAGDWAWRLLAVVGAVAVILLLLSQLRIVVIPLIVAILISALLIPAAAQLRTYGWPRWLAIVVTLVVVLGALTGLGFLVADEVSDSWPSLIHRSLRAYHDARGFLMGGPFHFSREQLHDFYRDVLKAFAADNTGLLARAISVGSSLGRFVTGLFVVIVATGILLIDGAAVWRFIVRLFPRRARATVAGAGRSGWATLTTFVRVQLFAAFIDALGIGVIAEILRIPLALPIAVAVFLGSFVPVVGAVVTGIIAVFVALVYNGPVVALIMLVGVLVVQQLEGRVLRPLTVGTPVKVHPLGVVLAVAVGSFVAGVPGALFAVPVVATANTMVSYVARSRPRQPLRAGEDDMVLQHSAAEKGSIDDV
jgi:predicted PurR-regulated permease PerM